MKLLKGDVVAAGIKAAVKEEVQALCAKGGRAPHVAIVEAAEDSAAHMYIGQVERTFKQVGIESARVELRIGAGTDELVATIQRLAKDDGVNGILLPTPLPRKMSLIAAQDALPPDKDIEGISSLNVGRLALGQPKSIPATPLGGMEILRHYGIPVEGRRAVVLGRSPDYGDHWLVVVGFDGDNVHVLDPDDQRPRWNGWIRGGDITLPVDLFEQAMLRAQPGPYGMVIHPPSRGALHAGMQAKVSGTDGDGAFLRNSAGTGDNKITVLPEGTVVSVVGPFPAPNADGHDWIGVVANGQQGFVAAEYLVPAGG